MTSSMIPLPSELLVSKLYNMPILTAVPAVLSFIFTMKKQILCGWSQDITSPVSTAILIKYLEQCFKLVDNIDNAETFKMLRINFDNGQELILIPNHEDGVIFCVVVERT